LSQRIPGFSRIPTTNVGYEKLKKCKCLSSHWFGAVIFISCR